MFAASAPASTGAVVAGKRLQIKRAMLPNGVILIANENPTHPSVALRVVAAGGQAEEPIKLAGLAGFTGAALLRGTERMTFEQINRALEERGIALSTGAGRHSCDVSVRCLTDHLSFAIEVLADVLGRPTFPDEDVEKLRGEIVTGIRQEEHDTGAVAERLFREAAYPEGHPYRRRVGGYEPTVSAIDRSALEQFHRDHVRPERTIIAAAGDVGFDDLLDRLSRVLGDWENGQRAALFAVAVADAGRPAGSRQDAVVPGKTQSDIFIGAPALRRTDPAFYALHLCTLILGQLGLMGRLGANVRDKQGLAYFAASMIEVGAGPAPWSARAGVNRANVEQAIASILAEMRRMREEPVTDDELQGGQGNLTGSLTLRLETNDGIADLLQFVEFYGLGLDFVDRYPDIIKGVTKEAILSAAQTYLPIDDPIVVVAGPPR